LDVAAFVFGQRSDEERCFHALYHTTLSITFREFALGSEVTYIVGPPGTGKTSTLAAIAFTHLQQGRTVLIAAQTNMAVDNAIMRLADICKDTKNSAELQGGRIVRYGEGAPQLAKRLASEYSDVHIPTIVERRGEHLHQQRGVLQAWLDQVSLQLNTMNQENALRRERWQSQRQRLSAQCDAYKRELRSLQECEQQHITTLNTHLRDLTNKLVHGGGNRYVVK
jgi:recombinational DNA repair ATPase RecF